MYTWCINLDRQVYPSQNIYIYIYISYKKNTFRQVCPSQKQVHHSFLRKSDLDDQVYPPQKQFIPTKPHLDDQTCPPPPRDVAGSYIKLQLTIHLDMFSPRPLPLLLLIMECVRPYRSTCCHADVIRTAADSARLPQARFLPPLIFQQQNARDYMPRDFAPLTVGCTRLAGGAASREIC